MMVAMVLMLFGVAVSAQSAAQSSVALYWPFPVDNDGPETFSVKGTDATATTYQNVCPPSSSGASSNTASASSISSAGASTVATSSVPQGTSKASSLPPLEMTPIPAPTSKGPVRRAEQTPCFPYEVIQGASTWAVHISIETQAPGVNVDFKFVGSCNWQGAISTATAVTCKDPPDTKSIVETDTLTAADLSSFRAGKTVALVSASTTPAAGEKSGLAAPGPLPTGAIAFVGGAAGILAAALAL
ncbi:hypothetical protein BDV95DRAFT_602379 [Massariosphaeria phaeospora]|uniref:Uncharacterized protein n=1 Tax=Massariosphaeria phaeospora TaxID=100035 RepID=A0A7C8IH08_9PLEO|nr:hypothetical protein BDV95DRAFT_602379 [Massariosphaeria phaeospora]